MKNILFYAGICILAAIGLFFRFALIGYSFLALVCFGLAALMVCYRLLRLLGQHHLQTAKALRLILTIVLCFGLTICAVTGACIAHAAQGTPHEICEYMVVLGAGVNGSVPSLTLKNRLDSAVDYLKDHPETTCIVSGGQGAGENITEALCMFQYLAEHGIDSQRIWMEDQSTSTRENLDFSLSLIEARTGSRPEQVGILSSEYHLYRATLVANKMGISALGIPGKTTLPVLFLNYFLREIPAVWYYTLLGG